MDPFFNDELRALEEEYMKLAERLSQARRQSEPRPLEGSFEFETPDGQISLEALFDARPDLLVIHNMGTFCSYCTLWGDTLIGLHRHLTERTQMVMISPDPVDVQQQFAESRGWPWPMARDTSGFSRAVGYASENGMYPGCTTLYRSENGILITGQTPFGPYDQICGAWHLMDLLKDGPAEWEPKH